MARRGRLNRSGVRRHQKPAARDLTANETGFQTVEGESDRSRWTLCRPTGRAAAVGDGWLQGAIARPTAVRSSVCSVPG